MSTFTSYSEPAAAQKAASASTSTATSTGLLAAAPDDGSRKKKVTKRRKVNHACLYCRRSHMTCDEGRPCQRCIKREIGHLCHDERRPKVTDKQPTALGVDMSRTFAPVTVYQAPPPAQSSTNSAWPMSVPQGQFLYQPETLGNEFSVLSDFLETLDEGSFFTSPPTNLGSSVLSYPNSTSQPTQPNFSADVSTSGSSTDTAEATPPALTGEIPVEASTPVLPAATKTEKFLLTAADQESGSRNERLNRVIRSKYEAGLLKPYNYVKGYARLSRWMDRNVSQDSKQQILQPLSVLRPKFRAVAQSLRDLDLVFIEEAFERLLLDYDRVFSAMGVPACLWRRTGEIYKGNREFTELIGVDGYMMRDGRLCIYELMAEESAVNYWEKYGHVAFDSSQKAVLTSCVLRYRPQLNAIAAKQKEGEEGKEENTEEGFVNCCFSFTIRRDKWGIPTMIVGNFIKC
ncbi:hypothetical protein FPV67DRAFT_1529974 [Lyophyllum atratum]|nr:hypothetical protein FPV67DRAFT_1529974 [Lyophyllum atratum]